jgi:mannose-6-phosphate isomerase-like protein (cupin superfamily)
MREPTVIPPGGGEVIGDSPERRVEVLADDESLCATWSRFGPGREGADLHVHRRHSDFFYVLAGELTVRLGPAGDEVRVPAGTLARVPPLVVHGFRNASDGELRYINLHAPGQRFADYLRALRDGRTFRYDQEEPPADGGRPATEAVVGDVGVLTQVSGFSMRLLADVEVIGVAEVTADPPASTGRHAHQRHAEWCYVLDGELAIAAGDRELRAPAGSWVHIPSGVPHAISSAGSGPVRFLDLHSPGGFDDVLRDLAGEPERVQAA